MEFRAIINHRKMFPYNAITVTIDVIVVVIVRGGARRFRIDSDTIQIFDLYPII